MARRYRHAAWIAVVVLTLTSSASAQTAAASKTRPHVVALASDPLAGRLVGSDGEKRASDYLAAQLRRIGAQPLPGRSDFLIPF